MNRTRGKRKEPAEQKILLPHFPALAFCAIVTSTNSKAQALNPKNYTDKYSSNEKHFQ